MRHFTREQLDRAFNAKTVAVIGAKKSNDYLWLRRFQNYTGTLYSVHTNPESAREIEARGIKNFVSILDVPGPVDYVVVNTPRSFAEEAFAQCVKAGVAAVSYYTSGFAEMDAEGAAIQQRMAKMSRESGVVLFGPNCTGAYNPALGMQSTDGQPVGEAGPVAMVSQSGTHAGYFGKALFAWYGLRMARGISFGNAAAMDAADWIEYMGEDEQVKVLGAYIEGIGDREAGDYERFVQAVRRVASKKPVVIWKGGNTEDGGRVTGLHTGAKRVTTSEWEWVLRASGAIGVDTMEALVDTAAALVRLPELRGPRGGVIVLTGGQGIAVTDSLARRGLRVPEFTERSVAEFASFLNPVGGSYHNPLDAAYMMENPGMLERELQIMERDERLDFAVMDLFAQIMPVQRIKNAYGMGKGHLKDVPKAEGPSFLDVMAAHATGGKKPFFTIVTAADREREALDLRDVLKERGVLAFPSAERAAVAYERALAYWMARRG